ncbi:protein CUSTOS-like isoform X2 [Clytia hemisphaerica]|uniref:protein CUSTOS-like isoform X2 n=1 Tax=Clytia hemisphaerica TaxID=252671 RepID=UPI0034D50F79
MKEPDFRKKKFWANLGPTDNPLEKQSKKDGFLVKKKMKSMRYPHEEDARESVLNTTPEFRNFVGKKLDTYLASVLEDTSEQSGESSNRKEVKSDQNAYAGIKLLAKSSQLLLDVDNEEGNKCKQTKENQKKKKRRYSSSSSSDDDELDRLRSAAVTFDTIAKGSAIAEHQADCHQETVEREPLVEKKPKKKKKKKCKTEDMGEKLAVNG